MNKSLSLLLNSLGREKLGGVAIDVGAHHGLFSKALIDVGYFAKVIAFEPSPQTSIVLAQTLRTSFDFEIINLALSDKSGIHELFSDSNSATASLLPYSSSYATNGVVLSHTVAVTTLDVFMSERIDLTKVDLIKIDTQGNDLSVLRGGEKTISDHRPIIQVELNFIPLYAGQCTPEEIRRYMADAGYLFYSAGDIHVSGSGQLAFCDAIFVPKEMDTPFLQDFFCVDDLSSYEEQIRELKRVCDERLELINSLDRRLKEKVTSPWGRLRKVFRLGQRV